MLMDYLDSNIALISRMQDKGTLGRFEKVSQCFIIAIVAVTETWNCVSV